MPLETYDGHPNDVPTEAAAAVSKAIFARDTSRSNLRPIGVLVCFITGRVAGDEKPLFGAGVEEEMSEDEVAELLAQASGAGPNYAGAPPDRYGDGAAAPAEGRDVDGSIPWLSLLPTLLKLALKIALGKKS